MREARNTSSTVRPQDTAVARGRRLLTKIRARGPRKISAKLTPAAVRLFRFTEKILGVPFVLTVAWGITAANTLLRADEWTRFRRLYDRLPARLRTGASARRTYWRMLWSWHSGLCLSFLYDRLGEPRWARRITVRGPFHPAHHDPKQPVILTYLHAGASMTAIPWMRSLGFPATCYIVANHPFMIGAFAPIQQQGDARYGLTNIPLAVVGTGPRQLRQLSTTLKAGGMIAIAFDSGLSPAQLRVPAAGGSIALHDGAIRLAMARKALLVPGILIEEAPFRFAFIFGRPVPTSLLESGDIHGAACHLANELMPVIEAHPGCLTWTTMDAVCGGKTTERRSWP